AWSRKPEDVEFDSAALARIQHIGDLMARKYHSRIPLMPTNAARVRVARLAVAIATRLFSTDKQGRKVKVPQKNVNAAGSVYANLLKDKNLEYLVETRDMQLIDTAADENTAQLRHYLSQNPMAKHVLRNAAISTGQFTQVLGGPSDASMASQQLVQMQAISLSGTDYVVNSWARKVAQEP